jgi:hypothetical protein
LFYLLQYATQWKRKCNPKHNSYLLAYDHIRPRGGVGVGGDPSRRGVEIGCQCPPLHLRLGVGFLGGKLLSRCMLLCTYKLTFMSSLELQALESTTSSELNDFDLAFEVIKTAMGIFFIVLQQLVTRRLVPSVLQGAYEVREEFLKKMGAHL